MVTKKVPKKRAVAKKTPVIPMHVLKKREEKIQKIIGKAVTDPNFLDLIFKKPQSIAEEFDLDQAGLNVIKGFKRIDLERLARSLRSKLAKESAVVIFCG